MNNPSCHKNATMNQHPLIHDLMNAHYDLVMDDPQLNYYLISSW